MSTFKFKTNIKCTGCLEKVAPHLNENKGVQNWEVDINDPNKILTAELDGLSHEELVSTIQKAGFKAEPLL